MSDSSFVPFHRPTIGTEEFDAVRGVLESRWLTTGPVAQRFEREFAEYIGCKHALAVNSATGALQLAMDAIGITSGDEVLVPSYTFTATAEVATYFGARPVLCDSQPGGFNLDPDDVEKRITRRTRAIIPVHIAGEPCDLDAIRQIAERHNLYVIEDAAHALPTTYRGRRVGTISDLTAFSFYATKTITTGEGGMVVTNEDEFANRISSMRLHGISGDAWKRYSKEGSWYYEVEDAGYKLNLCDLLAALGSVQLAKCDQFALRRRALATRYLEAFAEMQELQTPPLGEDPAGHAWHLFILRIRPDLLKISRNEFIQELKNRGVGTSVHFIPLHLHPFYKRAYGYCSGQFPNAEDAYSRCLSLPIFPDMTDAEQDRVISAVRVIVKENRKRKSIAA
ncbi:MAG: UDP-4-amino-4,6-dideoxy-N-acetyl-beta-L-altrosamine transaminase [Acidobacteria bacterium]|nr:MAG: UDP-4-amino-4,6-dideoxy-N-acetyl-beta-L-altrosamine transaminase [Acidobacteriota bacterium]